MKLHEVLRHYRKQRGLTQQEVADMMGIAKSTYSGYETGRRQPGVDEVKALAKIFSVTGNEIIGNAPLDTRPVPPQGMVPVIGMASAGKGVIAAEDIMGYESADKHYADNPDYRYIKVIGDSMSPKIDDGDLVLVHYQTSVDSGSVGVFIVDGEDGYVKKVEYDTEYIHLISFNPYYPPMVFEGPEVLRVRVVGKVVSLVRKF